jgi:MYXO-CTERM domain-containing protein
LAVGAPASAAADDAVRLFRAFDPGPVEAAPIHFEGTRLGQVVLRSAAGAIAVDPETGHVRHPPPRPVAEVRASDSSWYGVTARGLWRYAPGARRSEPIAAAPQGRRFVDVGTVDGSVYVVAGDEDRARPYLVRDGDLEPAGPEGAGGRLFSATDAVWLATEVGPAGQLRRYVSGSTSGELVRSGTNVPATYAVERLGAQTLVVMGDGVFRYAPESAMGGLERLSPGHLEPMTDPHVVVAHGRLWVRARHSLIVTDGTPSQTRVEQRELERGSARFIPFASGAGLQQVLSSSVYDLVSSNGEVLERPCSVDAPAFDGEAAFLLLIDVPEGSPCGLSSTDPQDLLLVVLDGDGEHVELARFSPSSPSRPRLIELEDAVYLLEHRAGQVPALRRLDARRSVGAGMPISWARFEATPVFPQAVLEGGALAAIRRDEGRQMNALELVDPETGALVLGSPAQQIFPVGDTLYFVRAGLGRGVELWRWRPELGAARIRSFGRPSVVLSGAGGRPLVFRTRRRSDEGPSVLQIDEADVAVPIFEDLVVREAHQLVVRDDEVHASQWTADGQQIHRWSADVGESEVLGTWSVAAASWRLLVAGPDPALWALDYAGSTVVLFRLDDRTSIPDPDLRLGDVPWWGGVVQSGGGTFIVSFRGVFELVGRALRRIEGLAGFDRRSNTPHLEPLGDGHLVVGRASGEDTGTELAFIRDGALVRAFDLYPGPASSEPSALTPLADGSGTVFVAATPEHGRELWFTDGTDEGTRRVCDFIQGPNPGVPADATIAVGADAVYVPAFVDGVGTEIAEVPMSIVRGEAPCRPDPRMPVVPPPDDPGALANADGACRCVRWGAGTLGIGNVLVLLVLALSLARRSRASAQRGARLVALLSFYAASAAAPGRAVAQDDAPSLRVLPDLRPGPPVPATLSPPSRTELVHADGWLFVFGHAVELSTGRIVKLPVVPDDVVRIGETRWFLAGREVWRTDRAWSEPERVAIFERAPRALFVVDGVPHVELRSEIRFFDGASFVSAAPPGDRRPRFAGAASGAQWYTDGERLLRVELGEVRGQIPLPRVTRVWSVLQVEARTVVVLGDGPYRLDGPQLVRLLPDDVVPELQANPPVRFVVTQSSQLAWLLFDGHVIATDGTAERTRIFDRGDIASAVALEGDRLATWRESLATVVVDVDGRAILEVEHAPPHPLESGALLFLTGAPAEPDRAVVRADPSTGEVEIVHRYAQRTERRTFGFIPTADGGAVLAHQPPAEGLQLQPFDRSGRPTGTPRRFDEALMPERSFGRPGPVLPSGEIVVGRRTFRPPLAILDPVADEVALSPTVGRFVSAAGSDVYFWRDGEPAGSGVLYRWTKEDGAVAVEGATPDGRVLAGVNGRPLMYRQRVDESGRLRYRDFRLVDERGEPEPIFTRLPGGEAFAVTADPRGVWVAYRDGDRDVVARWNVERGEAEVQWSGPTRGAPWDLWVAGDAAQLLWQVRGRAFSSWSFVYLDDRSPLPETDFEVDAPEVRPEPVPGGVVYGRRLYRFDGPTVRTVEDEGIWGSFASLPGGLLARRSEPGASESELVFLPDGSTRPELVKDIWPGPIGSWPGSVTTLPAGDRAVFSARTADAGRELWVTDGRAAGTYQVCEFQPGPRSGVAGGVAVGEDALYVTAYVDDVGTEIVEVPLAAIRGEVDCVLNGAEPPPPPPPPGARGPGGLGTADPGCACRTDGAAPADAISIVLVASLTLLWGWRRRSSKLERDALGFRG